MSSTMGAALSVEIRDKKPFFIKVYHTERVVLIVISGAVMNDISKLRP
jgi:hypothetical protein